MKLLSQKTFDFTKSLFSQSKRYIYRKRYMARQVTIMLYSDKPIQSSQEDQLGRNGFAKLLA